METIIIVLFVLGYLAITLEHNLKVDKLIPALGMMAFMWAIISLAHLPVFEVNAELKELSPSNIDEMVSLKIAFDSIDLDQAELELGNGLIHNLHIQTLAEVEIKNSKKTDFGQGVIEQLFIGPHRPSGFKGLLDGITK